MSLSARIAPHLAYLRRYARAVSGSQTSGDAYAAATLEALISNVDAFPKLSNDRVALYHLLAQIIETTKIDIAPMDSPFMWEKRASAHLGSMSTTARQAFLLMAVEAFAPSEIGEILACNVDDVHTHLAEAARQISQTVATDIMIIEDEPLIAMEIEALVMDLGHTVTGIARTHKEAVKLYREKMPKMILADIQLADGSSGIDAVNDILKTDDVPVIFITAFPERLLTGERPEPTFLVTKPFNPDMVKALISQALFFQKSTVAA